jgi:thiamine biosynthesis protein ThiI
MSYIFIPVTMPLFIIRYGEIGLKSGPVRKRFEEALIDNLMLGFAHRGLECRVESERGRVFLWSDSVEGSVKIIKRIFGVVSLSQAIETTSSLPDLKRVVVDLSRAKLKPGMSFRIRARRTGRHGYTSMDLARDLGAAVIEANHDICPKVDLQGPDLEIHVEVRHNRAFVFTEVVPGPGGLPVGTQGRVLCPLHDERDAAAAWLMMKRGCKSILVTDDERLVKILEPWDPELRIVQPHPVGIDELDALAREEGAEGMVLGLLFNDYKPSEGRSSSLPFYFPLIGMSVGQVQGLLEKIRV